MNSGSVQQRTIEVVDEKLETPSHRTKGNAKDMASATFGMQFVKPNDHVNKQYCGSDELGKQPTAAMGLYGIAKLPIEIDF